MVESMDNSRYFQDGDALIDAANGAAQHAGCDKHAFGIPDVCRPAAIMVGELCVDEHLAKISDEPRHALVRLWDWDIEHVYLRAIGCGISRVLTTTDSFLRKGEVNILFTNC